MESASAVILGIAPDQIEQRIFTLEQELLAWKCVRSLRRVVDAAQHPTGLANAKDILASTSLALNTLDQVSPPELVSGAIVLREQRVTHDQFLDRVESLEDQPHSTEQLCKVFQMSKQAVGYHISRAVDDGEMVKVATGLYILRRGRSSTSLVQMYIDGMLHKSGVA